jgi:hypothetical protein
MRYFPFEKDRSTEASEDKVAENNKVTFASHCHPVLFFISSCQYSLVPEISKEEFGRDFNGDVSQK